MITLLRTKKKELQDQLQVMKTAGATTEALDAKLMEIQAIRQRIDILMY